MTCQKPADASVKPGGALALLDTPSVTFDLEMEVAMPPGKAVRFSMALLAAKPRAAARRRRAGSPAMPSLEDDEDAKAVKSSEGDIPPIVQKVTIA